MMIRESGCAFGRWKIYLYLSVLAVFFAANCGGVEDKSAGVVTYQCPAEETINCMPPVQPENEALCSGDYHNWIVANCPDVTFTY